jgi:hypothetical protein
VKARNARSVSMAEAGDLSGPISNNAPINVQPMCTHLLEWAGYRSRTNRIDLFGRAWFENGRDGGAMNVCAEGSVARVGPLPAVAGVVFPGFSGQVG